MLQEVAQRFTGVLRRWEGVAVCLCGEAGLGKSHLAAALLQSTPCHHLTVQAHTGLAEVAARLPRPDRLPVWAERNLDHLLSGTARSAQAEVEALTALLAAQTPFLLVIEDLHEASPEALERWQALAAAAARSRGLGLIGTSRGNAPEPFQAVTLSPLGEAQTAALVEAELGGAVPEDALAWIQTRTGGNPLYVLEHARFLARLGFLWSDGHRWRWRTPPEPLVPGTLEAMIEHELRTVTRPPEVRAVLEAFSVLDARGLFSLERLAQVAGVDPDQGAAALALLEGAGVTRAGGFRHPLYREVVARALSRGRRTLLERRAFDAVQAKDPLAAARFLELADVPDEAALEVLGRAGAAARAAQDPLRVARMQALATRYTRGPERAALAVRAAAGLRHVSLREALPLAELAVRETPDDPAAAGLLAELLASQGRMQDAERVIARLPARHRSGPMWPERLLHLRAEAQDFSGVLEVWQAHPALRRRPSAQVSCHVGWALLHANDTRQARALVETLEGAALDPDARADRHQLLAAIDHYEGRVERAVEGYQLAVSHFQQVGAVTRLQYVLRGRANALMLLGRPAEARTDLLAALDAANRRGDPADVSQTQVSLGALLTDLGAYEAAEDLLTEALDTLEQMVGGPVLSQGYEALFWLYRAWNPPLGRVLALKHARSALDLATSLGHARLIAQAQAICGAALAASGDPEQGRGLLDDALQAARALNEPERICIILLLSGGALSAQGRTVEATAAYREAEGLAAAHGLTVEAHRAGLDVARLSGDRAGFSGHRDWLTGRGLAVPDDQGWPAPEPATPARESDLRLEALGTMRMVKNAEVLAVRGGKRQELLAALLEARLSGHRELGRLELCDLLWPEDDEARAASSLKSLVHSVRLSFGPGVIVTTTAGYALGEVNTDVESFMRDHDTGWWRGPYLDGLDVRDDHAREGVQAALFAATCRLLRLETAQSPDERAARLGEAVRTARLLSRSDPYRVEFLALELRALQASGNLRSLGRAYTQARDRMLGVGERLPEHWSAFLAAQPTPAATPMPALAD